MQRESQRHYPNGSLAAHLIGGVDFEEKGNAAIEKALDEDLRGQAGQIRCSPTSSGAASIRSWTPSAARRPMTLTIDDAVQFVAERELAAAVQAQTR
jgi:cell division protein FtsI/penicillin-binding protein 2